MSPTPSFPSFASVKRFGVFTEGNEGNEDVLHGARPWFAGANLRLIPDCFLIERSAAHSGPLRQWGIMFQAFRFLRFKRASLVGSRYNHAGDAIRELRLVEVDDETDRDVEQPHIAEELRLVNGQNLLRTLEFEQQAVIDEHVKAQWFLEHEALVLDFDETLD